MPNEPPLPLDAVAVDLLRVALRILEAMPENEGRARAIGAVREAIGALDQREGEAR
jgi:hypothetical protein